MPPRVALIAALEREVAPLTRNFVRQVHGGDYKVFVRNDVFVVCAGIGGTQAAQAARWAIASLNPEVVMSVGFAGALVPDLKVADVIAAGTVIDDSTGERFSSRFGQAVLVTHTVVLPEFGKRELAVRYGAHAVDMEAAAVARVAQQNGIPFGSAKAISDEVGFAMPPMQQFVDRAGKFRTVGLLGYAVLRPALWPVLARLGANAKKASSQLCDWLQNQISRDFRDILQKEAARP